MSSQLAHLTRAQKAAAILVAMGKPSASRLLKFFKQEELKALIEAARLLRTIPQSDLEKIVAEFEAEFTEGAGLLDSADKMDTILNENLTPEEVNRLMGKEQAAEPAGPASIWPDVEKLDPARIGAFIAAEHPQIAAVILSKLAPQVGATVLLTLEKPARGEIVKRMMNMSTIPEPAVRIVENQLRGRVLSDNSQKDTSAGQSRVASLLNEMDKSVLDEVMQDLEEGGTNLDAIRARLFAFEDILELSQKARVALFDGLSTELVTLALRNCDMNLAESILSSIGARSRRMIEAELAAGSEGVANADIVQARKSIASTAIRMSSDGVFELPSTQNAA